MRKTINQSKHLLMAFLIPLMRLKKKEKNSHGVHNQRVNHHSSSPSSGRPAALRSDFGKGELVHAPQLLHGDLEGVFVGVVLDDVVIHVN